MLLSILWDPDPIAFHIFGYPVRWYALFWCAALLSGYYNMSRLYRKQNISEEKFEPLFLYCFFGVMIGARLGHCLFYDRPYYLSHPVEMLLPVRHFSTGWRIVGYEGLASHGGVVGLIAAIWLYCRKTGINIMHVLDNMGVIAPLSAGFIRLGNLVNSEIVGVPTDLPWGFVFLKNHETFARHPAQLYESMFYMLLFIVFILLYNKKKNTIGSGWYFGLCLTVIFTFRFFIEFIKADQVSAEADYLLNIGQQLSIPLVLVGVYCMCGGKWCRKLSEK